MKTFRDNQGRIWTITIHVGAIKRVRGLINVDLMTVVDGTLLKQLVEDPVYLCDVIYALIKPDADSQGVSDEEFGRAMAGHAIEEATTALLEELVGFFHGPKRRVLEMALRKMQSLEETASQIAEKQFAAINLEGALPVPETAGS